MLQKAVNKGVWLLLILGALSGIATLVRMFGPAPEASVNYSADQALAEHVARSYLTYNSATMQEKNEQLSMYPEDLIKGQTVASGTVQTVRNVTALEPVVLGGNRIKIPVDTWVMVNKKKGVDQQEEEVTARHLRVSVFMMKEGGTSTILGLPIIEPQPEERAQMSDKVGEQVSSEEKSIVEPVLKAFLTDYYSAADPLALQNILADGVRITPMGGQFTFDELKSSELFSLGGEQYFAVCNVQIMDPVLDTPVLTQMRIGLVKKQDKFFVSSINQG